MKVLFVITTMGHGKGGHFHSLNHISQTLGEKMPVKIISIGPGRSDIIKQNPYFLKHIDISGTKIITFIKELKQVLSVFEPSIIHFFDISSYNVIRPIVSGNQYKFVVNKCGGPNPQDFPLVENLILFSEENKLWFKGKKRFRACEIYVIPNRTTACELTINPKIQKDSISFCFVRIARIGKYYIKSIQDSINLVETLKDNHNLKVKLYIIGTIQDNEVYKDLMGFIENKPEVVLITDDEYTKEASKMLYLADAVIATGRGIMEATSLGLPVLTPASNSKFPILIKKSNFQNFFNTNFSERNLAESFDLKHNMVDIIQLVSNQNYYKENSNYSLLLFKENFDVIKGADKYINVYKNSLIKKNSFKRYSSWIIKLKSNYQFYIKSI